MITTLPNDTFSIIMGDLAYAGTARDILAYRRASKATLHQLTLISAPFALPTARMIYLNIILTMRPVKMLKIKTVKLNKSNLTHIYNAALAQNNYPIVRDLAYVRNIRMEEIDIHIERGNRQILQFFCNNHRYIRPLSMANIAKLVYVDNAINGRITNLLGANTSVMPEVIDIVAALVDFGDAVVFYDTLSQKWEGCMTRAFATYNREDLFIKYAHRMSKGTNYGGMLSKSDVIANGIESMVKHDKFYMYPFRYNASIRAQIPLTTTHVYDCVKYGDNIVDLIETEEKYGVKIVDCANDHIPLEYFDRDVILHLIKRCDHLLYDIRQLSRRSNDLEMQKLVDAAAEERGVNACSKFIQNQMFRHDHRRMLQNW